MHTKKRTFNIFNRLNVREGNKVTVEKKRHGQRDMVSRKVFKACLIKWVWS